MTRRLAGYVRSAYPPAIYVPYTVCWAIGLTALLACASGSASRWRLNGPLIICAVTLVINLLMLRALDDIRDHDYDRLHNPGRPLPSGAVSERDLITMIAVGIAAVLILNSGQGVALAVLAVQLGYAVGIIALDRLTGWPPGDRLMLHLAVNVPIQPLMSVYVYASFLRTQHLRPSLAGVLAVTAATLAGLALEFGRKATRGPRAGERTYATVLGPLGTTAAALALAAAATALTVAVLRPWDPAAAGYGWGWLVLAPAALPGIAAIRFTAGTTRWPKAPTLAYVPVMHASFAAVGLLAIGLHP